MLMILSQYMTGTLFVKQPSEPHWYFCQNRRNYAIVSAKTHLLSLRPPQLIQSWISQNPKDWW